MGDNVGGGRGGQSNNQIEGNGGAVEMVWGVLLGIAVQM